MEYGANSYAEVHDLSARHAEVPDRPRPLSRVAAQGARRQSSIPIIASLNGNSRGGWTRYAEYMEEAGADALELNIFDIPTDPSVTAEQLEHGYCELVRAVRKEVQIPISVKLGPYFTSWRTSPSDCRKPARTASSSSTASISPTSIWRRWRSVPNLVLSSPHELRLRLHWAAILYHQVETYIAITGGVHDSSDVLKSMMAGAHVAMMTSALLKYGIEHIGVVLAGMERWMEEHEYQSRSSRCGAA